MHINIEFKHNITLKISTTYLLLNIQASCRLRMSNIDIEDNL